MGRGPRWVEELARLSPTVSDVGQHDPHGHELSAPSPASRYERGGTYDEVTMPPQAHRAQFKILGFPVHVRAGFVIFMILLAVVPRGDNREFGYWLAGAVAVFTLIHELGHALVARQAGAEAEISLEFMAGYASYRAPQPLSRLWTVAISLAGPLTHIAVSVGVLAAMGVNPLDRDSVVQSDAAQAIWWAGPIIGAFNLFPVLPLDGGHVVETVLDRFIPGRANRVMLYASVAVTGAILLTTPFIEQTRPFTVFVGFLLILQLATVFEDRRRHAVSPFDTAVAAMRNGDSQKAVKMVTRGLTRPSNVRIVPASLHAGSADELRSIVALLPRPLPQGDPWNEYMLSTVLVRLGLASEAAEYSAQCFAAEPNPLAACGVARAAAAIGDGATAAAWLRAARDVGTPETQLRQLVMGDPEFATVRGRADVQALIGGPGTAPTFEPRLT